PPYPLKPQTPSTLTPPSLPTTSVIARQYRRCICVSNSPALSCKSIIHHKESFTMESLKQYNP
ncbi:hypothetical protein, partial [Helicobacter sp.]|uniref:hypothetical protein n=1 Tax=Helicobacter sp. TaxID=218 RepID=UPI002A91C522